MIEKDKSTVKERFPTVEKVVEPTIRRLEDIKNFNPRDVPEEFHCQSEQNSMQRSRFSNLDLAANEVFTEKFLTDLNLNQKVKLDDAVVAKYEKEYNVIRVYLGRYPDVNTVNFWLDEKGRVNKISDLRGGPEVATLDQIVKNGWIKPEVLSTLGVTEAEISDSRALDLQNQERLAILRSGSLSEFPRTSKYTGNRDNTQTVLQGEAHFISPNGKTEGLYTFGAGPCAVVVVVARGIDNQVSKLGMAHLDGATPITSIQDFLRQAGNGDEKLEVYLISGERETALRIDKAISQKEGAKLVFARIDDGSISDAVLVDKTGRVYYGERMDLANVDEMQLAAQALARQFPDSPLSYKNHD
jgi:hypothetical protein